MASIVKKLLIANRGEIALRVVRTAKEMGISTVAVYSEQDRNSRYVDMADEAYLLSGDTYKDTYLNEDLLIDILHKTGANAVHPGYGFLSEVPSFAQKVEDAGAIWVGPHHTALVDLGDKITARRVALRAKVPPVPGLSEPVTDVRTLLDFAHTHGYPIMMKRTDGGGGHGITVVHDDEELRGNFTVYSTRDCSLQRRNQKLVEEAPAPFLSEEIISTLEEYSRRLFTTVGYVGLGTCEFMVTPNGKVYFLEVNPRLQVEHTVSEEVSGLDLVREQLNIAAGGELTRAPELRGHSFELRITSEDPATNLTPGSGTLEKIQWPAGPGVRIDTGVEQGDTISPKFDSMMGKVIVTAQNRLDAVARVRRVLDELVIEGVPTPIPLFKEIFRNDDFTAEHGHPFAVSTKWLERTYLNRTPASAASGQPASLAAAPGAAAPAAPDKSKSETFVIEMNNRRVKLTVPLDIVENITGSARARGAKRPTQPLRGAGLHNVASSAAAANDGAKSGVIASPMQAVVTRINVSEGQQVAKGDLLVVLESMKMENYVYAPAAGEVKKIFVGPADGVEAGDTLVTLDVNAGKAKAAAAAPGSLPQAAASTAPSSEGADKATDAKKEGGND